MTQTLRRRELIATGLMAAGSLALGPEFWQALARPARVRRGLLGALGPPDVHGLQLPPGFNARVVARGQATVAWSGYEWHLFSDGAATFPTADGGWILVSNSEVPTSGAGGASAIRFAGDGTIVDAYRILSGTTANCAGGTTPWGTWLSCEEVDRGLVWECDPTGQRQPVVYPALGVFKHEAVCVDPRTGFVYLTEDLYDGCLYRFRPTRPGDLSAGRLQVARVKRRGGDVRWLDIPDPSAADVPTRHQVRGATRFSRGEGIWIDSGTVYIATTGDGRIWGYDTRRRRIRKVYDPSRLADPPLTAVDGVTVHPQSGNLFVCEDGGADALDIALITPGGRDGRSRRTVARFARLSGGEHGDAQTPPTSELTGACFDPHGNRLYFASQRAGNVGAIYEVSGPFRRDGRRARP